MTLKKKWLIPLLLAFLFLLGFNKEYHWPKIKTWVLVQLENISHNHLPIRVLAKGLHINLWPPSLALTQISIIPKGELKKVLGPIEIDEVSIVPGTIELFKGNLQIAKLKIDKPIVNLILKKSPEENQEPISFDFQKVFFVPLHEVDVNQMQLQLRVDKHQLAAKMNEFDFNLRVSYPRLFLQLNTPKLIAKKIGSPQSASLAINAEISIEENKFEINHLKIKKDRSFVSASGSVEGDLNRRRMDNTEIKIESHLDLPNLQHWVTKTFPQIKLPEFNGNAKLHSQFKKQGVLRPEIRFQVSTTNLAIDQYIVGHLKSNGRSNLKSISTDEFSIENDSGLYRLNHLNIELNEPQNFSFGLDLKNVSLQRMLENIGLNEIPANIDLSSELPCNGLVSPSFQLKCQGKLTGKNLYVGSGKQEIVRIDDLTARGDLQVNTREVRYNADLALASKENLESPSIGKSSGVITYDKGFDISFESSNLHMKNIRSLAGLDLKGSSAIKGKTQGNSSFGTITTKISPRNFYFQNFWLGNFDSSLTYERGQLSFKKVNGTLGSSPYSGNVAIDLNKSQLSLDLGFSHIDAKDIKSAIIKQIPVPFDFNGTGSANFKLWGPFELNLLSYKAFLQLSKGAIGLEKFETLILDISSDKGYAKTKTFEILKGDSSLAINGTGQPNGNISGQVIARKLRLENSELIQSLGLKMRGSLNFNVDINGPYHNPLAKINGILSGVKIANTYFDTSHFEFTLDSSHFSGKGNLFGENIKGEFSLPLKENESFFINASINDWNFIPLFGIFNPTIDSLNYRSMFNAKINLSSQGGGFWSSNGKLIVDNFQLRRGDKELRTKEPMVAHFKEGVINTENFVLHGIDSFVKTEIKNSTKNNFDGSISGKFDFALLVFLTPFFEDLHGPSSFSFKLGGHTDNLDILGSAFIDGGYIKFYDFPHPFEKIKGDFLISQSKLLINSLSSNFAEGQINANGNLTFQANQKLLTSINITANGLKTKFPRGVRTDFSAKAKIHGKGLPLYVSGNIDINKGELTEDFDQFGNGSSSIKANPFLPKLVLEEKSSPFLLDLDIHLVNPFLIRNSLVDAKFIGSIEVNGDPLEPSLNGKLNALPNGQIKVQKHPFDLTEAVIQFRNLQPIDPLIYTKASGRKDDHEIQFSLDGPLSTAKDDIQLTSEPELTKDEIVQLLAFGIGDTDEQAIGQGLQILGDKLIPPQWKEKWGLSATYRQDTIQEETDHRLGIKAKKGACDFSATTNKETSMEVKAECKLNKNMSIITSWEDSADSETSSLIETDTDGNSRVGLDLEFKFKFE